MNTTDTAERRLLLVDDDPSILSALTRTLGKCGWVIETAIDGFAGLDAVQRFKPHVVISDFRMPLMNGSEFLERVIALRPKTQRIMLTGQADVSAIVAAESTDRPYQISYKPWDNATLIALVADAFKRAAPGPQPVRTIVPQPANNRREWNLVGGLVHEINNTLSALLTLTHLLTEQGDSPRIDKETVALMRDATLRCQHSVTAAASLTRAAPVPRSARTDLYAAVKSGIAQFSQVQPHAPPAIFTPSNGSSPAITANFEDVALSTSLMLRLLLDDPRSRGCQPHISCTALGASSWAVGVAPSSQVAVTTSRTEVDEHAPFLAQVALRMLRANDAELFFLAPTAADRSQPLVALFKSKS